MPLPRGHPYKYASPASGTRRIIIPGTCASCTLSSLSASGGTISWTQATNAAGYQWFVGTASGSGTISSGTVSGGSTVTTNFTVSLTASTNYYGWVIAYSSTGDFGAYTYSAAATWSSGGGLYSFTTITFTNAGYTGMAGPILSACVSAYQATNSWVTNTAYFKMSSYQGYQQWTVPSTAPYTFVVAGAGYAPSGYGYGAVLTSTLSLTQGDVINICVGQQGLTGSASGCGNGYGGSGGTFVVNSTTGTPLIIAGGGAGSTVWNTTTNNMNASLSTSGKLDGNNHGAGGSGGYGGGGGYGCCCQAGGGGGYYSSGTSYSGMGGGGYNNGLGGGYQGNWFNHGGFGGGGSGYYPGGGGGGYSGGSGGGLNTCSCSDCQGGGGGGSYSSATITSSSVNNNGMGYVQVTINAFGPPQTVTVSSADTFLKTSIVTWSSVYQAVSYTVSVYQNVSNSTTGGTLLGTATTTNTTYTLTGLTFSSYASYYANFLLTTFYANTGSIPDASGPTDAGGNGTNWGSIIQSVQALNPIYFGNNQGIYIAGQANYSALTTGYVYSASAGTIQFQGITDDGLIVNFNGTNVIYQYQQQGSTTYYSGSLTLPAGYTPIRITWYDTGGGGDYRIYFSINGGAYTNDGTGVFYNLVPAGAGYVYATVYATNATPTNTAATASTTTSVVTPIPANLAVTTNLSTQTAVGTWSFVDHAYITSYTVSLYTNTTNSTSGATLITSITTSNLTYTFTGLSLVLNNYAFITVSATGTASTTGAITSPIKQILNALYAFTTITFTNCSATGVNGPSLGACVSAYQASNSWVTNTSYFNMTTTGYQLWTAPRSGNYTVRCAGAATSPLSAGFGCGVIIETVITLSQGQLIQILVGQMGQNGTGGASGGGGGSFVASGSTPSTGTCLVAAGGGGGHNQPSGSDGGSAQNGSTGTSGNNSSDTFGTGGSGGGGGTGASGGWGGGGGGFTGNGTAASYASSFGYSGLGLSFINGGTGGNTVASAYGGFGGGAGTHGNTGGGGGGGGYSGGGGSGQDSSTATGGGGGSFPSGATYIGTNTGMGYVTITLN